MADAILGEDELARNDQSASIPSPATDLPEHWFELAGIVDDPLLDPDAQVAILARIDETGSAPLGDLAALLHCYPKPVKSVLQLVRRGILAIEPGLTDANSLLSRLDPPRRKATERRGEDGQGQGVVRFPAAGELRRLDPHRPQPEIFIAAWTDRGLFRREPMLERAGIYLALFSNCAYVGMSAALSGRLVASNHLLEHGIPDLVIAAVDRNNLLSEEQARVAERLLAREVERHGLLRLANNKMPVGGHVDMVGFSQVERFVRDMVRCLRDAGLAFAGPVDRPRSAEPVRECAEALLAGRVGAEPEREGTRHFTLHSCGVHATAVVKEGRWIVQTGSQIRSEVLASAGPVPARQRQELLHDGGLVEAGRHLLLTRDIPFETATAAARFVVGVGHKGRIWRALPSLAQSATLSL